VATGALRGAGNTRTPMLWNLVCYWVLDCRWVLALFCKRVGGVGLWDGLCLALVLIGAGLCGYGRNIVDMMSPLRSILYNLHQWQVDNLERRSYVNYIAPIPAGGPLRSAPAPDTTRPQTTTPHPLTNKANTPSAIPTPSSRQIPHHRRPRMPARAARRSHTVLHSVEDLKRRTATTTDEG